MLIAQITDIHLGFDPVNPDEFNRQRLDATLAALPSWRRSPICCWSPATSPMTATTPSPTSATARRSPDLPFPVFPLMGNHDSRAPFLERSPKSSPTSTASSNMRSRTGRCASSSSTRSRSAATAAASARSAPMAAGAARRGARPPDPDRAPPSADRHRHRLAHRESGRRVDRPAARIVEGRPTSSR